MDPVNRGGITNYLASQWFQTSGFWCLKLNLLNGKCFYTQGTDESSRSHSQLFIIFVWINGRKCCARREQFAEIQGCSNGAN